MTDPDLDQALASTLALYRLNPPISVRVTLTQFVAEVQREMNSRPDAQGRRSRHVEDFTDAELAAAIGHLDDLRGVRPRHGVQLMIANFQLSLMVAREQRRMAKEDHRP